MGSPSMQSGERVVESRYTSSSSRQLGSDSSARSPSPEMSGSRIIESRFSSSRRYGSDQPTSPTSPDIKSGERIVESRFTTGRKIGDFPDTKVSSGSNMSSGERVIESRYQSSRSYGRRSPSPEINQGGERVIESQYKTTRTYGGSYGAPRSPSPVNQGGERVIESQYKTTRTYGGSYGAPRSPSPVQQQNERVIESRFQSSRSYGSSREAAPRSPSPMHINDDLQEDVVESSETTTTTSSTYTPPGLNRETNVVIGRRFVAEEKKANPGLSDGEELTLQHMLRSQPTYYAGPLTVTLTNIQHIRDPWTNYPQRATATLKDNTGRSFQAASFHTLGIEQLSQFEDGTMVVITNFQIKAEPVRFNPQGMVMIINAATQISLPFENKHVELKEIIENVPVGSLVQRSIRVMVSKLLDESRKEIKAQGRMVVVRVKEVMVYDKSLKDEDSDVRLALWGEAAEAVSFSGQVVIISNFKREELNEEPYLQTTFDSDVKVYDGTAGLYISNGEVRMDNLENGTEVES